MAMFSYNDATCVLPKLCFNWKEFNPLPRVFKRLQVGFFNPQVTIFVIKDIYHMMVLFPYVVLVIITGCAGKCEGKFDYWHNIVKNG